jgi:hypothetical protein
MSQENQKKKVHFKNLLEEINGELQTSHRFHQKDELVQVENLEKWVYDNTELKKTEMLKATNGKKSLNGGASKYEQKLKMPELNLDVLNLLNDRERIKLKKEGKMLRNVRNKVFHKTQRMSTISAESNEEKQEHYRETENRKTELNSQLLDKMLIKKIERKKIEIQIQPENRMRILSQIHSMAKDMISHFKTLRMMIHNNYKFDFEKFMAKYSQSLRINKNNQEADTQDEVVKEQRTMMEDAEKELIFYKKYFETEHEIKIKNSKVDSLRKINIQCNDWIKNQLSDVSKFP